MATTCDVIYVILVAMETSETPRGFAQLNVQKKFIICTKYHVNRMNYVENKRGVRLTSPQVFV